MGHCRVVRTLPFEGILRIKKICLEYINFRTQINLSRKENQKSDCAAIVEHSSPPNSSVILNECLEGGLLVRECNHGNHFRCSHKDLFAITSRYD